MALVAGWISNPYHQMDNVWRVRCDEGSRGSSISSQHIMPHFMLRDGRIQELPVHPDGLELFIYTDLQHRQVHVLLSPASQVILLRAQPRQRPVLLRPRQRQQHPKAA